MNASPPTDGRFKVPRKAAGQRFDQVLAELIPDRSLSQVQKLVRRGRVRVAGRRVTRSNFPVQGGELVQVRPEDPGLPELVFLLEEPDFAVLDKPAGVLVHPTSKHVGASIAEALVARHGPLPVVDDEARPGVVHRLDRETSGLLLVAFTEGALAALRRQFADREVEKRYFAFVHGEPREDVFEVDLALSPTSEEGDRVRVDRRGKPALSRFRVLRRWGALSFVECLPHTGRRHQLRVHLQAAGHPIVGDELYRPKGDAVRLPELRHLGLHAEGLAFNRPSDGERLAVHAPLPEAWRAAIQRLGK